MFDTLKKVLLCLIDEQEQKCNQIIKTDSNCSLATSQRFLDRYKKAYDEYLQLVSFYENFSNVEDDQFE